MNATAWVIAASLLLAVAGCDSAASPPRAAAETIDPAAAAPDLVAVDTATVEVPLALPAQLYVEHDAIVAARSQGVVESVLADLGTPVAAGQLIAKLESVDQEIALAQARESFENETRVVRRTRELSRSGAVTVADSEQVETRLHQAEIALRKAQRDLDLTRIAAPFAGVVTSRTARPRRLVAPGDTLFRVTAAAPLLARVRVPESAANAVRLGSTAEVVALGGLRASGRTVRASPAIDPASGTREVIVELAPGSRLQSGASVTVRLGRERRTVTAVPLEVIAREGYALVWEHGRSTLRAVTLGAELGDGRVEVVSGLAPGERVLRRPR